MFGPVDKLFDQVADFIEVLVVVDVVLAVSPRRDHREADSQVRRCVE